MTEIRELAELRALRDDAWAVVRSDIEALTSELENHGIGERIKDRAADEARQAWDQAVDIASDNKGIVAATALALFAWLLRGPLGDAYEALFGDD